MRAKISDDYLKVIGEIAVHFGTLEWIVDQCLIELIDHSDSRTGSIITFQVDSFGRRLAIVDALLKVKLEAHTELLRQWTELQASIRKVQEERNRIFHSSWFAEKEGLDSIKRVLRKRDRPEDEVSFEVFQKLSGEIVDVNYQFVKILKAMEHNQIW